MQRNGYSRTYQGPNFGTVATAIMGNKPLNNWTIPTLLAENIYGFNVVGYHQVVYAIPQSEGAFDLDRIQNNGYSKDYQGPNFVTVAAEILQDRSGR